MNEIKAKRKVYTQIQLPLYYQGEVNSGEIVTVPDQSMSLRHILDNFTKGIPINSSVRTPVYNEDYPFDDPRAYDLAEVDEQMAMYKSAQDDANQILDSIKKEKAKRKKDEESKRKKDVEPNFE